MNIQFSHPKKLPMDLDYGIFARELADAQYELGLLEGLQKKLQNSSLLIAPLTAKEAAVSSRIEGTQSTASDVFLYEAGGESLYKDTAEVVNYRKAMTYAIGEVREGVNFSPHLLRTLHGILLKDVRHKGIIGQFREDKVWIAEKHGDPIEKATYIPPEAILVPEYVENLMDYIKNADEKVLVLSGMVHYQFEAVHPFEDGNGRIGRLLIPFILHYKKQLSLPIIYLSGYFDEHRDEYIDSLHNVDRTGNYEIWLTFFLRAIKIQCGETRNLIEKIYDLYDSIKGKFEVTKSPYLIPFLDFIFGSPIFSIPKLLGGIKMNRRTAVRLIKLFQSEKILVPIDIHEGKIKFYAFNPLLNLLH